MKLNRSWLSLLTFCATASLAAAFALATVFTAASVVASAAAPVTTAAEESSAPAPQPTFSGVVTDNQCGARHDMGSDKSPAECTLACIRNGAKYSLVNGDQKYNLEGNAEQLRHWAGQRATIAGSRSGDTIQVTSVSNPN